MAHTYSNLYNIPTTGLRFFTVYGPWDRPDMAAFLFAKAIFEEKPIDVYNYGDMKRDFTYVDDIIEGIFKLILKIPSSNNNWNGENPDPSTSFAPYRLFNIGNNKPVKLDNLLRYWKNVLEKRLIKSYSPCSWEMFMKLLPILKI